MMAMKILHADDHALFREGMKFFLKLLDSDVEIVEASNFQALMDKLALEAPIDLLLMDLAMPGMGELEGFFSIRRQHPKLPVVVLSGSNNTQVIQSILDGGARGYIPKLANSEELMHALRQVTSGKIYSPNFLFDLSKDDDTGHPELDVLTARQRDILALLADGMPNKLIGSALGITEGTVKQHLKSLYKRLDVQNRTQAVRAARTMGLIEN
jgi:DNA-binding NarL/FixJ family response regulator